MDEQVRLHAYVSFQDGAAGLAWLEQVGFEVVTRVDAPGGAVLHAEVRLGDALLMVASADEQYEAPTLHGVSTGGGLYLWMPNTADVDDWHARALAAGARDVIAPEDTEWGTRRARVLDPGGHEWSVGTYAPGSSW
jgi:uncharacterized glyoxalase superfamily protein PhnB